MTEAEYLALQERVTSNRDFKAFEAALKASSVKAKVPTEPRDRQMNKTERLYSRHLDHLKQIGHISAYWYEPWKIRIADNCTWTPDFVVINTDGTIEWQDTKSWWAKAKKVGIEEDALIKMKAAAEMYPQFKVLATWFKDGVWEQRVF